MSLKIVFNGREYDSVDAMPPDVRKEYEVALETLRKSGGDEILTVLQRDMGVSGTHSTPKPPAAHPPAPVPVPAPAPTHRAMRPPPIANDAAARGGGLRRIVLWIGVGAAAAWWLLRHG